MMDLPIVLIERMTAAALRPYLKNKAEETAELQEANQSSSNKLLLNEETNTDDLFSILQKSGDSENSKTKSNTFLKEKHELKSKCTIFDRVKKVERVITIINQNENKWKEDVLKYIRLIKDSGIVELKYLNAMRMVDKEKLVQFLKCLELIIKKEAEQPLMLKEFTVNTMETSFKILEAATDCCLTLLYIMTSSEMPNRIYLENIIESIIVFINFYLSDVIFPLFDDSCENNNIVTSKIKSLELPEETKLNFYEKSKTFINLFLELLNIQTLAETSIAAVCSSMISSFFVENITELQLCNMKLLTHIFGCYEKEHSMLLQTIFVSLFKLPANKIDKHNYRLHDGKHIKTFSALIVQLLQSVVVLPRNFFEKGFRAENIKEIDKIISDKYERTKAVAGKFFTLLLDKCNKKLEEFNCKILLENFIYDLLLLINRPEWPVTRLLLTVLGVILVNNFSTKELDVDLRLISLEFLSIILIKFRKNELPQNQLNLVDDLIENVEPEKESVKKLKTKEHDEKEKILKQILLDYLTVNIRISEFESARHFYVVQWYMNEIEEGNFKLEKNERVPGRNKGKNRKRTKNKQIKEQSDIKGRKELMNQLQPFLKYSSQIICEQIDHKNAELIIHSLTSKIDIFENFDKCLRVIILMLNDPTNIKMKTLKCLGMIIKADMSLLNKSEVQLGIKHVICDHSPAVREAALDLVAKFITQKPDLIDSYYEILSARLLDASIGVRKRAIRILNDICISSSNFSKKTEVFINVMRRINDEESVQKLVTDIFLNTWFTPSKDQTTVLDKISKIKNVVKNCDNTNLEFFRRLLLSIFKLICNKTAKEKKAFTLASKQIINRLIKDLYTNHADILTSSTILYMLSQIAPHVIIEYIGVLRSYLISKYDIKVTSNIIGIFKEIVPKIPETNQLLLHELEKELIKLILKKDCLVTINALSCLGSVIKITRNFELIRECFKQCYEYLVQFKSCLLGNKVDDVQPQYSFRRAVVVIGLLLQHFNFNDQAVTGDLPRNIKQEVLQLFLFFLQQKNEDVQLNTVKAIGWSCLRCNEFILDDTLQKFYQNVLLSEATSITLKESVLKNLEIFFNVWSTTVQEIVISSEIISLAIQRYIKEILQSYLHPNLQIRQLVHRLVQLVLRHGVIHPTLVIPYLICISTDIEKVISDSADKQLLEFTQKHSEYIGSKLSLGLELSYQLQTKLCKDGIIRGFNIQSSNEYPVSLHGYLYSLLRNVKQQRRTLVLTILQQFGKEMKGSHLSFLLYLTDNLACFQYAIQDEVLFLMYRIDQLISYSGMEILQSFKKHLKPVEVQQNSSDCAVDENLTFNEDKDEDEVTLLNRLPDDMSALQLCINSAQGYLLLMLLKQYLKQIYGMTDQKIQQYSPTEAKLYEKPIARHKKLKFEPTLVIEKLQQGSSGAAMKKMERRELVCEYLHYRQLVLQFDTTDPNEDIPSNTLQTLKVSNKSLNVTQRIKKVKRRTKRQKLTFSMQDYDTEETDSE